MNWMVIGSTYRWEITSSFSPSTSLRRVRSFSVVTIHLDASMAEKVSLMSKTSLGVNR